MENYLMQVSVSTKDLNVKQMQGSIQTQTYNPPTPQKTDEFVDMGSIEIEIDGEADPEMVMAEVKEIIEERKRKIQSI